jgi:hypothetical protein
MFSQTVGVNCFDFRPLPKACSEGRMAFNPLLSGGTTFLPESRESTVTAAKVICT